ncbi:MAG: regulatory iron-sulfur-containing complex subunit RicT [Planctomycetota bacterium]|nr:regulatory iron-sulfur-containing complex subunit RicT [Planctomycetota bacterium]
MRSLGVFSSKAKEDFARGNRVVLRTNRGLETGEVLVEATDHVIGQMENPLFGHLLRKMSTEDIEDVDAILARQPERMATCKKIIREHQMAMKLIDIEQLFGGEKMVIYYIADERVDFRELVRALASEFKIKIEMRQVGVRDEAKLLADYGDCGKPVCCNTHLSAMPPVSMRMAKVQRATLDPNKISGRCGRLKCCLRYEFETYEDLQRELPPVGSEIRTEAGTGKIINLETLTGQLVVVLEDRRRIMIDRSEVLSVIKEGPGIV